MIIQIAAPDPARNDPGKVAIGFYTLYSSGVIEVANEEGHPIGTGHVEPGGDAAATARAVLRRKLH